MQKWLAWVGEPATTFALLVLCSLLGLAVALFIFWLVTR